MSSLIKEKGKRTFPKSCEGKGPPRREIKTYSPQRRKAIGKEAGIRVSGV